VARAGIDLGGTKIQAVVVDDDHTVLGDARAQTPPEGKPKDVAAVMAAATREACQLAGVRPKQLTGVGAGSPGIVDAAKGTVSSAKNLPGWGGTFALSDALRDDLGVKRVGLGNDVEVATHAEFELGAGQPFRSLLGVFWGTGVGGGIVLDGRMWKGRGAAGEIGHVVVERGGRRCPCGRRGCMEAYAGRSAMEARARKRHHEEGEKTRLFKLMEEHGRERLTSGIWSRAYERGDTLAVELLDEAVMALGTGVASVCNVLDPEAIILGGGMGVRFGEPFAERIGKEMLPHLFHDYDPPVLKVAELGDLGGAIGASLLVAQ
jgi:glucokinase